MFMKKSKKSAVGRVDTPMLFVGVNETGNNDSSAKNVVFFKPITVLSSGFKTGSFGFANG
jgi:hypothetical protein